MKIQRQNTESRLKKAEEMYKGMFRPKINEKSRVLSAKRKSDLEKKERAKSPALMAPNHYFSRFLQKDWQPKTPFKPAAANKRHVKNAKSVEIRGAKKEDLG